MLHESSDVLLRAGSLSTEVVKSAINRQTWLPFFHVLQTPHRQLLAWPSSAALHCLLPLSQVRGVSISGRQRTCEGGEEEHRNGDEAEERARHGGGGRDSEPRFPVKPSRELSGREFS